MDQRKVDVLDKGWVEFVDIMPLPEIISPDLAIVNAARTSFLGESKGAEADKKLLFYLMRNRHTSPFEMVELKFRIRAPLMTWWQLVRHRTFNINMQSGRYTEFEEDDFYFPYEWRKQSTSNKQASEGLVNGAYQTILDQTLEFHYMRSYQHYTMALEAGVAREQARLFLPAYGVYYTGVVKADAHNLMHFFKLRMAQEAQYEIRVYAEAMYHNFFKPALPITSEAFELYMLNKD